MLETITLTEVTDVITPEEETTPENYNFAMESTWEETIYSQGGGGGGVTPEGSIDITENGTYDVTDYAEAVVDVSNSYSASDEGKVVDDGALVAQTSQIITENGTHDTTTNNEVVVSVPNSYIASDEGKVVSNGALVSQTSDTVTTNDTYDTTLINSLTVNVQGSGGMDRIPIFSSGTGSNSQGVDDSADVATKIASLNYVVKYEIFFANTVFNAKLKQSTLGSNKTYEIDLKGKPIGISTSSLNPGEISPLAKITCDDDPNMTIKMVATANQSFRYTSLLQEIRPKLDFSQMTGNYASTWLNNGGTALTYVRCVPNTLAYNFGFDNSSSLTDDSIVSIANALQDGITGHSIKFHATPKARCDSIMGTVSQVTESGVTYNLFTADAQGATSLTSFITQTKGWTMA